MFASPGLPVLDTISGIRDPLSDSLASFLCLEFLTYSLTYRFPPLVVAAVPHCTDNNEDNLPKPTLHVLPASLYVSNQMVQRPSLNLFGSCHPQMNPTPITV